MATSSTVAFNPSVSQCIEEAYERCNVQLTSGMSLRTALFSLNILLSEWGNRGIHFWEVANTSLYLTESQRQYDIYWDSTIRDSVTTFPATTNSSIYINDGQGVYDIYWDSTIRNSSTTNPTRSDASSTFIYNATDILTAAYRTNSGATGQTDISLTKIDRSTYAALANKKTQGVPSQFWIERFIDKTRLTLYITPGSSQAGKYLNLYYVKRIFDAGIAHPDSQASDTLSAYSRTGDVPYRFFPPLISGLAFYLSQKIHPARTQEFKLLYEDELARALAEDGSASSTFVTPQSYYPAG